jgi:hypothetical protein
MAGKETRCESKVNIVATTWGEKSNLSTLQETPWELRTGWTAGLKNEAVLEKE